MRGDEFFRQFATMRPFSQMHPAIAAFFGDYLAGEKVTQFGDRFVLNTHFPPYPSGAFDNLAEHFASVGDSAERSLYSVTCAVTNRCPYNCWHCYNAGRSQEDLSLERLALLAAELQSLGVVMVTLTGGEPLLRNDLAQIVASFDDRTCTILNTTGHGLTAAGACALADAGLFALGVSVDSRQEAEHDRLRGKDGAFRTAVDALEMATDAGLYPYVISVATRQFLEPDTFMPFMEFASRLGAREVHLLEPSATGKLAGDRDVLLSAAERQSIFDYQEQIAAREDLPILSSFAYLEGPDAFGCGAGLTHLYIDGSGEVCPCNLVPLSFGNVQQNGLASSLDRMAEYFRVPRTTCVGCTLAEHVPEGKCPTEPYISAELCREHLPAAHSVPRFFRIRSEAQDTGPAELTQAYDTVHEYYDDFWLVEAAQPIEELVDKLELCGKERVFEAGCGTGYGTALIGARLNSGGSVLAADISTGMLEVAGRRIRSRALGNVELVEADALELMRSRGGFDLVFTTWVLGYISLSPFLAATNDALVDGGRLAFVVHKQDSPSMELSIFSELIAENPKAMLRRVAFDFPNDVAHARDELSAASLKVEELWEGAAVFKYDSAEAVLEHILKSGAGTAFYDAIDPARRPELERRFLAERKKRNAGADTYEVIHDYVACIARK